MTTMNDLSAPTTDEPVAEETVAEVTDTTAEEGGGETAPQTTEEAAETLENKGEDGGGETDAATPETPAPVAPLPEKRDEPAKPAEPDPAAIEAARAFNQRVEKFNGDFSALEQKITAGTLDLIDDGPATMKTLVEGFKLLAQELGRVDGTVKETHQKSTQSEQYEKSWTAWTAANPGIDRKTGEQWFGEELGKVRKQYPKYGDDALVAVATDRLAQRVTLEKAKRGKAAPLTPAASNNQPNNAGAPRASTQVAPRGTGTKPAPKTETAAEKLQRELGPISKIKLY